MASPWALSSATRRGSPAPTSHGKGIARTRGNTIRRELRSGTPERYRVVAIDSAEATRRDFTLLYMGPEGTPTDTEDSPD